MNRYIKAEFELFKKQRGCLIGGFCLVFVYVLLLLFSGVGDSQYCATITVIGYITYLFFDITFFLSPASYWQNRKKVLVTTEQLVLSLGESKRTYVKNKIFFCMALYFGMLLLMAVMQIPAALIAGAKYSLWNYGLEVLVFTAIVFMSFFMLFVVPAKGLFLAIPGWCGFCVGFVGGYFGVLEELSQKEAFDRFFVKALVGIAVGMLSIAYRYIRTITEERGGLYRRKAIEGEE